jgi:hypothetical protein
MASTITISGVGFTTTVEVKDGETYGEALQNAGVDIGDVDIAANGEQVTPDATTQPDAEVAVTPREAKLA